MTLGTALGLVGSIVGATAPSINALIAAETLIGLGGATQISLHCEYTIAGKRVIMH